MIEFVPEDRYIDVNGVKLHFLDWGNRTYQPMLLLHGFMAHAHVWDDLALAFRSDYHVIALDQRGHGESEWSEDGKYTIDDHSLDIGSFIEILGLKDLILIGHSMGGRNALFYTACKPHRVERVILVDVRPGNDSYALNALKHLVVNLPIQSDSLDEVVNTLKALYPFLPIETCNRIIARGYQRRNDGKWIPRYDTKMSISTKRSHNDAEELWAFLKHIPCATLVVRGEQSPFLSREDAQRICELMPKAVWREIPKATHMPAQENPDAFNNAVLKFLNS